MNTSNAVQTLLVNIEIVEFNSTVPKNGTTMPGHCPKHPKVGHCPRSQDTVLELTFF
jgi:hypothetical protein